MSQARNAGLMVLLHKISGMLVLANLSVCLEAFVAHANQSEVVQHEHFLEDSATSK